MHTRENDMTDKPETILPEGGMMPDSEMTSIPKAELATLRAERDELIGFIEDEAQLLAYDDDTTHDDLCIMVDQFRHKASALPNRIT